jgi:AcrR family transcriptional regulator
MILSAAALLREYGASATSIDQVLAHSGAPRGSVYHHFPGGRTQLIDEAVALAGDFIAGLIDAAMHARSSVRAEGPLSGRPVWVQCWHTRTGPPGWGRSSTVQVRRTPG